MRQNMITMDSEQNKYDLYNSRLQPEFVPKLKNNSCTEYSLYIYFGTEQGAKQIICIWPNGESRPNTNSYVCQAGYVFLSINQLVCLLARLCKKTTQLILKFCGKVENGCNRNHQILVVIWITSC